jgi:uncharacterized repeat protein (TIGR01451 family)
MPTNGSGLYQFGGLPAGDYVVTITAPSGMASTIDSYNPADNADPDTNAEDNDNGVGVGIGAVSANILTMTAGEVSANITLTQATGTTLDNSVDFGFVGLVALGNQVWFDDGRGGGIVNNGMLDGGESGVPNLTVELYTAAGGFVASTTTDVNGYYQFDQLYPGTYYVLIPASQFQTGGVLENNFSSLGNGSDETSDATTDENGVDDATPAIHGIRSIDYTLTPGAEVTGEGQSNYTGTLADANVNFTADLGFTQDYSIGDQVWYDTDGDGIQDAGEVGIANVTVYLDLNNNGAHDPGEPFDITDTNGIYTISGLALDTYTVRVDATTLPAGVFETFDLDSGSDSVATAALTAGQIRIDVDFGYAMPSINLMIGKSDGGITTTPGGVVAYTLTYTNNDNHDASGVVINETVPANASFNAPASTAGWNCASAASGRACTFTIGTLARAASGSVTFAVTTVTSLPAGVTALSNTASITDGSGFGADANPADNSANDTTPITTTPDLQIAIQLDNGPTVDHGGIASYTVTYSNIGHQDATGTVITIVVPANTTFEATGSTPGWSCTDGAPAGTICTFPIGNLLVGTTGTITFVAQIDDPIPANVTTINIVASIADDGSNGADPTPANNAAAVTAPFAPTAVTLTSFTATHTSMGILVRWATSVEIDTWGFHLYRSATGQRADAVRVTAELISATGTSTSGASYSWTDTSAEAGGTYTYWLEEVELDGTTNQYGPASTATQPASGYAVMLPLVIR